MNINIAKAALRAVFLIAALLLSQHTFAAKKSAEIDFAYPKSVAKSSRSELDRNLKNGNYEGALRNLLTLTVAENLVSNENTIELLPLVDSLAKNIPSPYSSVAFLIEADIYTQIYGSIRYKADNRVMSPGDDELNPKFWDASQFSSNVNSLLLNALKNREVAESTPLPAIKKLINDVRDMDSYTVYDFLAYKTISLREQLPENNLTIPFYKNDDNVFPTSLQLVDRLLSLHPVLTEARICAISKKVDLMDQNAAKEYLWHEISCNETTSKVIPLVTLYYQRFVSNEYEAMPLNAERKIAAPSKAEFFNFVCRLKERFGKITEIDRIYARLTYPEARLSSPATVIPGSQFPVTLITENLNDFYLLLIGAGDTKEDYISAGALTNKKIIFSKRMSCTKPLPFSNTDTVFMTVPQPGRYVIVASSSQNPGDILTPSAKEKRIRVFTASDIDIITLSPEIASLSDQLGCFVVKATQSTPVEGAEVEVQTYRGYGKAPLINNYKTDSEGFAAIKENGEITATFNGSKVKTSIFSYERTLSPSENIRLFSSQAVYRPGDTLEFFGIVYNEDVNHGSLLPSTPVEVCFLDANRQKVDSLAVTSDSSGRIYGKFAIPKTGLLGSWRLSARLSSHEKDKGARSFNLPIQIEEYKVPSFLISLERNEALADSIEFQGSALTYTGMPVAFSKVDYTVGYQPNYTYRWMGMQPQSFTASAMTDADGNFTIKLPLDNIDINRYRGIFTLTATVTDKAGETAESSPLLFWLHDDYSLSAAVPDIIEVSGSEISFDVKVNDAVGLPVVRTVEYQIETPWGKIVKEGEFESPLLKLDAVSLPSGAYIMRFRIKDSDSRDWAVYNTTVYRSGEKTLPVETALWVPIKRYNTSEGDRMVEISYGSSYPGQNILCLISTSSGTLDKRWLVSDGSVETLKIPVPATDERTYVRFITYRDHIPFSQTVTVIPEVQNRRLEIVTETFRSRISAGERESWKFKVLFDGKPAQAYSYALLYDRAMDAICPMSWNPTLFSPVYPDPIDFSTKWSSLYSSSFTRKRYPDLGALYIPVFQFDTYGYPLYSSIVYKNMALRKSRTSGSAIQTESMEFTAYDMAAPMMAGAAMKEEAGDTEAAVENDVRDAGSLQRDDIEVRPIEMPVALFLPDLGPSASDSINIEFTTSNFNTTWKLLLGVYTSDLQSSMIELETVASKKIMVKMNAPRFVRTGDIINLTATVFNNSEGIVNAEGLYEIFNPDTGAVIHSASTGNLEITPSGSAVIGTTFTCPSDLSAIGLRVYGKGGNCSDGEETIIPVLPSSQPVVESKPFFLKPGTEQYEFTLPSFPENASVTFTYCDNPVWEAVTSLSPLVKPDNESVISLVNALYANCVGSGLLKQNPDLKKGLEMILNGEAGDSLLISNLQKDQELKIVSLDNTPWVNNAANENLRLSRLASLLEQEDAILDIEALWKKVVSLQNADGGWSWCEGMKSSEWITQNILLALGNLKKYGYLPDNPAVGPSAGRGLKFCDRSVATDYNKTAKNQRDSYLKSIWNYLYIRSFYPETPKAADFASISGKALNLIEKDWKRYGVADKAAIAVLLWREGKQRAALEILESLKEFATVTDNGTFFDNPEMSHFRSNRLVTCAQVIMAFSEIRPEDPIIDGLREWLLLQKQTQDWTDRSGDIYVINALLTSGTEWDREYDLPTIRIAGKAIETGELERLTGSCKVNVDVADCLDGKVEITRFSPSQAWGAVVSQFIAPMKSVEADAVPELSVSKEYLKLEEDSGSIKAVSGTRFNVGDKVRINVIIDCGREMDYVVLSDQRAACIEPSDQISAYTVIDGIRCYREIRNSVTNIFIPTLPKGKHVISYDCTVNREGEFASGIVSLQSLYAPEFTAHSAGSIITVADGATAF